jgi:hypothetical protein
LNVPSRGGVAGRNECGTARGISNANEQILNKNDEMAMKCASDDPTFARRPLHIFVYEMERGATDGKGENI